MLYLRNGQGDIVKLIDGNGASVLQYTYDSWGKQLTCAGTLASTVGANQPFRYRGYVYDTESGYYYLQSRYYDPVAARFLSADVLLSTGQGVIGNNAFAYCNNNPANMVDSGGCVPMFLTSVSDGNGRRSGIIAVTQTPKPQLGPTPNPNASLGNPPPAPLPAQPPVPKEGIYIGTFTTGLSIQAEAGVSLGSSIGYTSAADGEAWQFSPAVGGGSIDLSGGIFFMVTDAPDIDTLCRSMPM